MIRTSFRIALVVGLPAGFLVGCVLTLMEWRQNPGGIYQTQAGTEWDIVWQTWSSWFFPVALTVLILVWVTAVSVFRLRSHKRVNPSEDTGGSGP